MILTNGSIANPIFFGIQCRKSKTFINSYEKRYVVWSESTIDLLAPDSEIIEIDFVENRDDFLKPNFEEIIVPKEEPTVITSEICLDLELQAALGEVLCSDEL